MELHGFWINPSWKTDVIDTDRAVAGFRTEVLLSCAAAAAEVRITACDRYLLFLNGRPVVRGPARSSEREKRYDTADITPFLHPGVNAVAVVVTAPTGGCAGYGRRGFWCDGSIRQSDGKIVIFGSSGNWKSCFLREFSPEKLPLASFLPWQEHADLRLECPGWKIMPPDELPENWQPAWELGPAEWTPPWRHLLPRPTAMLRQFTIPAELVWAGHGGTEMPPPHSGLADFFNRLPLRRRAIPLPDPEGGYILEAGDVITFDLGKVRMTVPEFSMETSSESFRIECYYDIRLLGRPTATGSAETAGGGLCDSFILRRGENFFTLVTIRGCRFLTLRCAGSGTCRLRAELRCLEYPYDDGSAQYVSRDRAWTNAWQVCRGVLHGSTMDTFVDTVWREQALWTLDAAAAGMAAFWSFGDLTVWRHSLDLIASSIGPDGIAPAVALQQPTHAVIFDQTMIFVESAADYRWISGDDRVEAWYPAIERFFRCCEENVDDNDLFIPPAYSWCFIDWGRVNRHPYALTVNALLYMAAKRFSALSPTPTVLALQERLERGLAKFPRLGCGALADRLEYPGPPPRAILHNDALFDMDPALPLHGNAVLLDCGYFSGETAEKVARFLAEKLPETADQQYSPGWIERILRPLFRYGCAGAALAELRRRIKPLTERNIPTTGESFPFTPFNSSHLWGAQINTLLTRSLWGIEILERGCRRIRVAPALPPPDGSFTLHTPAGRLSLHCRAGKITGESDMPVEILP